MVDTVRTLSALQTLLADNSAGDISAQDVRDFLVSVFPPQFSGALVTKSSDQSVSNTTNTTVTWNTETFDTGSYHDNSTNNNRLTVPSAGYYQLGATVRWASNGTETRQLVLRDSGGAGISGGADYRIANSGSGSSTIQSVTTIVSASASDWYDVLVYQASGGNLNIQSALSCFWVVRLGQAPA